MKTKENDTKKHPSTGGATLVQIVDGDNFLIFNPPLRVDWVVDSNDTYPLGIITTAYVTFDFGLKYEIQPINVRTFGWNYDGITTSSSVDDVVKSVIRYDLFYAFLNPKTDPKYSHLYWALYGNLKDRCRSVARDVLLEESKDASNP